jgi:phosphoribosyl 1,2-cyclic phosphodiesterase
MKLISLASGSSGNATLLISGKTRILIDCGISVRELRARMSEIGERPEAITAVLISHEHIDHVNALTGLLRCARRAGKAVPVYLSEGTRDAITWDIESPLILDFPAGSSFAIGDVGIKTFTVPHDAVNPVGFRFDTDDAKIGFLTDLGSIPDVARYLFRGCGALMIETNHDTGMLQAGTVMPECAKRRIGGELGHLSNGAVAEFIRTDMGSAVRFFIASHVSRGNNTEELIQQSVGDVLMKRGAELKIAAKSGITKAAFESTQ